MNDKSAPSLTKIEKLKKLKDATAVAISDQAITTSLKKIVTSVEGEDSWKQQKFSTQILQSEQQQEEESVAAVAVAAVAVAANQVAAEAVAVAAVDTIAVDKKLDNMELMLEIETSLTLPSYLERPGNQGKSEEVAKQEVRELINEFRNLMLYELTLEDLKSMDEPESQKIYDNFIGQPYTGIESLQGLYQDIEEQQLAITVDVDKDRIAKKLNFKCSVTSEVKERLATIDVEIIEREALDPRESYINLRKTDEILESYRQKPGNQNKSDKALRSKIEVAKTEAGTLMLYLHNLRLLKESDDLGKLRIYDDFKNKNYTTSKDFIELDNRIKEAGLGSVDMNLKDEAEIKKLEFDYLISKDIREQLAIVEIIIPQSKQFINEAISRAADALQISNNLLLNRGENWEWDNRKNESKSSTEINPNIIGISHVTPEAAAFIQKYPDYFRGGVVYDDNPLSLPPGFVLAIDQDSKNPQHRILHYDAKIAEEHYISQQATEGLFAMNHCYFNNDVEIENLWSVNNRVADLTPKASNKSLVQEFFENDTLKDGYNFDYYENNQEAIDIFRAKLTALDKTIETTFKNDPEDLKKARNFFYTNLFANMKDLSGFIEGKELVALNKIINMPPEKFSELYNVIIDSYHPPKVGNPVVFSCAQVHDAYSSYAKFVDKLEVPAESKDKLMHPGEMSVKMSNPVTQLARIQYIVNTATDQAMQINNLQNISLDTYESHFYMSRHYGFKNIAKGDILIQQIDDLDFNLSPQKIITLAYNLGDQLSALKLKDAGIAKEEEEIKGIKKIIKEQKKQGLDTKKIKERLKTIEAALENKKEERDSAYRAIKVPFRNTEMSTRALCNKHLTKYTSHAYSGMYWNTQACLNTMYLITFGEAPGAPKEETKNLLLNEKYLEDINKLIIEGVRLDERKKESEVYNAFQVFYDQFQKQILSLDPNTKEASFNPNLKSFAEVHALFTATFPLDVKSLPIKDAEEIVSQRVNTIIPALLECANKLNEEERKSLFTALRFTTNPQEFAKQVAAAIESNAPNLQSDMWYIALSGKTDSNAPIIPEHTLKALREIATLSERPHSYDKIKPALLKVLPTISENNADKRLAKAFSEEGIKIQFNSTFQLGDTILTLRNNLMGRAPFSDIYRELEAINTQEDFVKVIADFEQQYNKTAESKVYSKMLAAQEKVKTISASLGWPSDSPPPKNLDEVRKTLGIGSMLAHLPSVFSLSNAFTSINSSQYLIENNIKPMYKAAGEGGNLLYNSDKTQNAFLKIYETVIADNLKKFPTHSKELEKIASSIKPSCFAMIMTSLQPSSNMDNMLELIKQAKFNDVNTPALINDIKIIADLPKSNDRSYLLHNREQITKLNININEFVQLCKDNQEQFTAKELLIILASGHYYDISDIGKVHKIIIRLQNKITELNEKHKEDPQLVKNMVLLSSQISKHFIDNPNIETLAKAYGLNPNVKIQDLTPWLTNLDSIDAQYTKTSVDLVGLKNAIEQRDPKWLEIYPYGPLDKDAFSTDGVVDKINQMTVITTDKHGERVNKPMLKVHKQELLRDFLIVNQLSESIKEYTNKELQASAETYRNTLQNDSASATEKHAALLGYLAVARIAMRRTDGKLPNSTQVLALLNNFRAGNQVVNEVQTGQGKSIISAISASVLAAKGYEVDVCTSSIDLAARDAKETAKFFNFLGTPYSTQPITQNSKDDISIKGAVRYSTIADRSLNLQKADYDALKAGKALPKVKRALIVDEFDAAATMTTVMRIAVPIEKLAKGQDSNYKTVYTAFNAFFDNNQRSFETANFGEMVKLFQQTIAAGKWDQLNLNDKTKDEFIRKLEQYCNETKLNPEAAVAKLLSASYQAYQVSQEVGNKFSVITEEIPSLKNSEENEKISVVKLQTNGVINNSVLSEGVHQCLVARLEQGGKYPHRFVVGSESELASSQTVGVFMSQYEVMNGYTGTYGQKYEIQNYNQDIAAFSIPKHHQHLRKDLEPIFAKDTAGQIAKIRKTIDDLPTKKDGRMPITLYCKDDNEAQIMYNLLSHHYGNIQKLDSTTEDLEESLKKAGHPGSITIMTSRFSRGTDIIPLHPKGLYVVNTSPGLRTEEGQTIGRSGRQDKKGTTVQILNEQKIREELSASSDKPINHRGKKLLHKYHEFVEQNNASTVAANKQQGELLQAYILLKQSTDPQLAPQDKQAAYKEYTQEFYEKWKTHTANQISDGNPKTIEQRLLEENPGLKAKLNKVRERRVNTELFNKDQDLVQQAKQSQKLTAEDFVSTQKSVDSCLKKAENLNPAVAAMQITAILDSYLKKGGHNKARETAVTNLKEALNKASNIEGIETALKDAQISQLKGDIEKGNRFTNRKGSRLQDALNESIKSIDQKSNVTNDKLDNILDSIAKATATLKKFEDIGKMTERKYHNPDDKIKHMAHIKQTLMENMGKYNHSEKLLAKNMIQNIDRAIAPQVQMK